LDDVLGRSESKRSASAAVGGRELSSARSCTGSRQAGHPDQPGRPFVLRGLPASGHVRCRCGSSLDSRIDHFLKKLSEVAQGGKFPLADTIGVAMHDVIADAVDFFEVPQKCSTVEGER
jgi:hypothetical protein